MEDNHKPLETAAERKQRMVSLYIVHCCMMVFSLGYSIVLTGVLPYAMAGAPLSKRTQLPAEKPKPVSPTLRFCPRVKCLPDW